MADYKIRERNLYDPKATKPFRLSRGKLDMFLECPQCFYLDRRLGVPRPDMPGFSLNNAVDALLKKEFDIHRVARTAHPLMKEYGIKAVPFIHEKMDDWRDSLHKGIEYAVPKTNIMLTGGVDDIWINNKKELVIVDYKATSTTKEISLEDEYKQGYKRQLEIYQWLFRQNGFKVAKTCYFVFVNGRTDLKAFDGRLEFNVSLIPYSGDDSWVYNTVLRAYKCLKSSVIPKSSEKCKYCAHIKAVNLKKKKK